jgi:hypothetical protein
MDGTGEPVALLLRPGNAGSNTAADHLTVLRDALRQLPDVRPGTRPGRKVLVRTDAAGCTHAVLNWLHAQRLSYSVGFPLPDTAPDLVARIPDNAWTRAYDSDAAVRPGAWVAELTGLLVCHEQLDLAGDLRRGEHPEPSNPSSTAVGLPSPSTWGLWFPCTGSSRIVRPQACLQAQDRDRVPERTP